MSVLLPNHLTTLPSASSRGTTRMRNHRYSPSYAGCEFPVHLVCGPPPRRAIHVGADPGHRVNDHLPTPTFPLLQRETGALVPAFVQVFLGPVRQARPQE